MGFRSPPEGLQDGQGKGKLLLLGSKGPTTAALFVLR